jgi:hypothetical protein
MKASQKLRAVSSLVPCQTVVVSTQAAATLTSVVARLQSGLNADS